MSTAGSSVDEEEAKVKELASLLKHLSVKPAKYCSDTCLRKFLLARHWNVKKAEKMLRETLAWRESYKPEEIQWEDIAGESESGKIYRASFVDKIGRTVLVMRPGKQNTSCATGHIKQLVYFMENAILNFPVGQEHMVWLIDFHGWSIFKSPSVKTARDIAYILQTYYPERLGLAILYNPPYIFETFWVVVKPFLDANTCKKVKFVYSKDISLLYDLFDMDKLEVSFGGHNSYTYNHIEYGKLMKQEDAKTFAYWTIQSPSSDEEQRQQERPSSSSATDVSDYHDVASTFD